MTYAVSIIICTRNRAVSLRETLASIGRTTCPADLPAELLVIDNGSTDSTAEMLSNWISTAIPIRYISEPSPGQCKARNRGVAEALGAIILFCDDDVLVPADWIEQMCRPIKGGHCRAVAGSIRMAPNLRRGWMTRHHLNWLLDYDFSGDANTGCMIGANMAFETALFHEIGGFDEHLGPGALGFSDDVLFSWMIGRKGIRIAGSSCSVEHHFLPDRLTRASLLRRATQDGQAGAYLGHHFLNQNFRYALSRRLFWNVLSMTSQLFRRIPGTIEGCPVWELKLHQLAAYWSYYCAERNSQPRYNNDTGLPSTPDLHRVQAV